MKLNEYKELLQQIAAYFDHVFIDGSGSYLETENLFIEKIALNFPHSDCESIFTLSQQLHFLNEVASPNPTVISNTITNYKNALLRLINEDLLSHISKITDFDIQSAKELLALYETDLFSKDQAGITMFLLARKLCRIDALTSYKYSLKAFKSNPNLTRKFTPSINYTYEEVEENFTTVCPICGSTLTDPYFNAQIVSSTNYIPSFSPCKLWMHCNSCNNLFAYNFPKTIEVDQTYKISDNNFWGEHTILPRVSIAEFEDLLKRLQGYSKGNRYLEVGIGTGEFLAVALENNLTIEGIEISLELSAQISSVLNIPIHTIDFLEFSSEKKYDVITLGDVIEHVKDPKRALSKSFDLLDDNGVLWISTPDFSSSFSMLRKFSDPMWIEPWHYTYFNKTSLIQLLETIGFAIVDVRTSKRYNGSIEIICVKS